MHIFSVKDRERVGERVLQLAASNGRVVAGAVVGSLALEEGLPQLRMLTDPMNLE